MQARSAQTPIELLEFDGTAGLFDLGLELLGLVALDAFLDGLRSLVDEGLRLLEAEAGGGADDLDDADLLVAGTREDDVDGRAGGLSGVVATRSRGAAAATATGAAALTPNSSSSALMRSLSSSTVMLLSSSIHSAVLGIVVTPRWNRCRRGRQPPQQGSRRWRLPPRKGCRQRPVPRRLRVQPLRPGLQQRRRRR